MTYTHLIAKSHTFNAQTLYKFVPVDTVIARYRVIELLIQAARAGVAELNLDLWEDANKDKSYTIVKSYNNHIRETFEGRITEALVTISTFFAHKAIDLAEEGPGWMKRLYDEPLPVMFAETKGSIEPLDDNLRYSVSELIVQMTLHRYKKQFGLAQAVFLIAALVDKYQIPIEKHLELFFKYAHKK